jgi:hypothetical protein
MSANRWRRALAAGGRSALASRGADGAQCKLSPPVQVGGLEAELDAGPVILVWENLSTYVSCAMRELAASVPHIEDR